MAKKDRHHLQIFRSNISMQDTTNTSQSWGQEHRNEKKMNRNTLDENSLNLQILRLKTC